MKYPSDRVFEAVQTTRCTTCFRACLHEGWGPQVGELTCGKLPHLTGRRDHIKMRDYLDRRVTPPKRVTSPNWSPPPPCKRAIKDWLHRLTVTISRLLIGRDDMVPGKGRDGEAICFSLFHQPCDFRRNFNEMDITNCQCYCRLWLLLSFKEWRTIFLLSELLLALIDHRWRQNIKNLRGTRAVVDRVVYYFKVLDNLTSFLW